MLEFPVEHVGATLQYSQPFSVAVSLGWLKEEGLLAETASPVLEERWHPDTAAALGEAFGGLLCSPGILLWSPRICWVLLVFTVSVQPREGWLI